MPTATRADTTSTRPKTPAGTSVMCKPGAAGATAKASNGRSEHRPQQTSSEKAAERSMPAFVGATAVLPSTSKARSGAAANPAAPPEEAPPTTTIGSPARGIDNRDASPPRCPACAVNHFRAFAVLFSLPPSSRSEAKPYCEAWEPLAWRSSRIQALWLFSRPCSCIRAGDTLA